MQENQAITEQCRTDLDAALDTDATTLTLLARTRDEVEAQLDGKSTSELEDEFRRYSECSEKLGMFHTTARDAFVDNHTSYSQMFSKIELLNQLAQFDFLGATPDDLDEYSLFWDGFLGTPGDLVGAGISVVGLAFSGWRYVSMNRIVKAGPVAGVADDVADAAMTTARSGRAMAVAGGVLSLAMAGFTVASAIKEGREKREQLRQDMLKWADWYAATTENALLFCYWSKTMRNEITELISNFAENPEEISDADFIAKLNGFMITAGELDAQLRLATRMLCDGLSKETIEGYTDLNMTIITYLENRVNAPDSTACAQAAAS